MLLLWGTERNKIDLTIWSKVYKDCTTSSVYISQIWTEMTVHSKFKVKDLI